jgi:hypothetical protein
MTGKVQDSENALGQSVPLSDLLGQGEQPKPNSHRLKRLDYPD